MQPRDRAPRVRSRLRAPAARPCPLDGRGELGGVEPVVGPEHGRGVPGQEREVRPLLRLVRRDRDERRPEQVGLRDRAETGAGDEHVRCGDDLRQPDVDWQPARPVRIALSDRVHAKASSFERRLDALGDARVPETRVQVDGGEPLPGPDAERDAAALCRRYGTLLALDEVQTGLGRTGRFFGFEHHGVEPDLVTIAKTLSGGLVPVAAVLCAARPFERVFDRIDRFAVHGSTFSKNLLAMTAGLATLHVLESESLVAQADRMGALLRERLAPLGARFEMFRGVRGRGLMIGLELGPPRSAGLRAAWKLLRTAGRSLFPLLVVLRLFEKHRILAQVGGDDCVKLLPPLVVGEDDVGHLATAFEDVLRECHELPGLLGTFGPRLAKLALRARRPSSRVELEPSVHEA